MYQRPEVSVFVDGSYLAKVTEALGKNIDLEKLFDKICEPDFRRKRTYYFDALPWKSKESTPEERNRFDSKQRFLDAIKFIPRTEVRLGRVQVRWSSDGKPFFIQKLVDVLLSLSMAELAWKKDVKYFILIAGDSDFVPAVQAVKNAGGTVKVVYCDKKTAKFSIWAHQLLKMTADELFEIDEDFCSDLRR